MNGLNLGGAIMACITGFMIADILAHPTGTQAAGGVITSLWKTSAQGVSGQAIS